MPHDNKPFLITFNGETHTLAEWSQKTGIKKGTLHSRLSHGWEISELFSSCGGRKHNLDYRKSNNVLISYRGRTQTLTEWAKETKIDRLTLSYRIRSGWSIEKAITTPVKKSRNHKGLSAKYKSEYDAWKELINRCVDPSHKQWNDYGGRGITVCKRWERSFILFINDMGPKPSPKHSLDRIDTNGNYTLKNCRWATAYQQARNTRKNKFITYKGKTKTISEWAEHLKMSTATLWNRLHVGWSIENALSIPLNVSFGPNNGR